MSWEVFSRWIEGHPGLASWVQAFGSIAAIIGAFAISYSQLKKQEMQSVRTARLKSEAFFAVVQNAARSGIAIGDLADQSPSSGEFIGVWKLHLEQITAASVNALKQLPAHELGSANLVMFYSGILGSLININSEIDRFLSSGQFDDEASKAAFFAMSLQRHMIEGFWNDYEAEFAKLSSR